MVHPINPPVIADHIEAPPGFEAVDACAQKAPRVVVQSIILPPPSLGVCVRHDLAAFAQMLSRRTLARAVREAATVADWEDVAFDFETVSRSVSDDRWRGARAGGRAAAAMARADEGGAAAALADFYGLTLDTWHWTTADDIQKGGAR